MAVSNERALEIMALNSLSAAYGGVSPVRIVVSPNPAFSGYNVVVSVPGQSRTVFIPQRKWLASLDTQSDQEEMLEEIRFAAFLLLDQDLEDA